MQAITIEQDGDRLYLSSPFASSMPDMARNLGGKWSAKYGRWTFAARDLELVRAMCRDIWGADDTDAGCQTVRLRCVLYACANRKGMTLCGVPLARAFERDSGAKLEQDVIVISGDGFGSGGSRSNWKTEVGVGTVLELRDLPAGTAAKIRAWCRADNPKASFVVEEDTAAQARERRIVELYEERDRLIDRLHAIEAEIAWPGFQD